MKHQTYQRKLKNGNRLAIIHVPTSPIFQFETIVESGFGLAKKDHFELPHLLEHLAFEGSKNYPDAQKFRFELEKYGIYHNARTSFYNNGYELYGAMQYWQHITNFALEQLLHPLFRQLEIDQQKEVVQNELTGKLNNPDSRPGYLLYQLQKNGRVQDYPKRLQGLKKITRQDIQDYYQKLYHPANMLHLVVGDLPTKRVDELAQIIESSMTHLPKKPAVKNPSLLPKPAKQSVHVLDYPYPESAVLSMSILKPGFNDEHYLGLRLLQTMLGSGTYSRLFQKARRAGLTYSIGSGVSTDKEMTDFYIYDKTQAKHILPLVELVLSEVMDLADGNFSEQEFERAVGFEVGRHAVKFQTAMSYLGWYADVYIDGLPLKHPDDFIAELQTTTKDDIIAAAKWLFAKDNMHRYLVVAGQGIDQPGLQKLLDGFGV